MYVDISLYIMYLNALSWFPRPFLWYPEYSKNIPGSFIIISGV